MNFWKIKSKFCSCDETVSCNSINCKWLAGNQLFRKGSGNCLYKKMNMHPCSNKKQLHIGLHQHEHGWQVQKSDSSHGFSICEAVFVTFGPHQCRGHIDMLKQRAMKLVKGLEHAKQKQRQEELNFFRLEERWQREDISDVCLTFCVVVEKTEPDEENTSYTRENSTWIKVRFLHHKRGYDLE